MTESEARLQRCYDAMFREVLRLRTRLETLEAVVAAAGLDPEAEAPLHRRPALREGTATGGDAAQTIVAGPWPAVAAGK